MTATTTLEKSFGMFSDGRLSSERFMAEKRYSKKGKLK
jgi:hypothetical protein